MSIFDPRAARRLRRKCFLQTYGAMLLGVGLGLAAGRTVAALVFSLGAIALGVTALVWAHRMEIR